MTDKITLRQRALAAWKVASGRADDLVDAYDSFHRNGGARANQQKMAPFYWPSWQTDVPAAKMIDYGSYVKDGFTRNSLIYAAIMYKVWSMTAAPLRAYTGEPDHPEPLSLDAPLSQLLARPNPHQSMLELHTQNIVYINVSGDCFQYLDRKNPRATGLPDAIYSLRPDRVFVIPERQDGESKIRGFLYVPEGKSAFRDWPRSEQVSAVEDGRAFPIMPESMIHTKFPNPGDTFEGMGYGLAPISACAYSADLDNSLTDYLNLFFKHGGVPPIAYSFPGRVDDKTLSYIRTRVSEQYGGYVNWIEPIVLDGGAKVERVGLTFEEMGSQKLDERDETRILMTFGVPGILVNSQSGLAHATMANAETLRTQFWQDRMIPESRLFEVDYRYYLQDPRAWPAFDFSQVPALQQDKVQLTEAAWKLWQMSVPANVALAEVGLSVEEIVGGDISYVPLNMIEAGTERPAAVAFGGGNGDKGKKKDREGL